jgi:hypothetical protein
MIYFIGIRDWWELTRFLRRHPSTEENLGSITDKWISVNPQNLNQEQNPTLLGEWAKSDRFSDQFDIAFSLNNRVYATVFLHAPSSQQRKAISNLRQLAQNQITTYSIYSFRLGLDSLIQSIDNIIAIFFGCDQPVVLHPHTDGMFQLVGHCIVYGLNDGIAFLGVLTKL